MRNGSAVSINMWGANATAAIIFMPNASDADVWSIWTAGILLNLRIICLLRTDFTLTADNPFCTESVPDAGGRGEQSVDRRDF